MANPQPSLLNGIYSLKFWGLREVLRDKYKLVDEDALSLADFLNSLLEVRQRALAVGWHGRSVVCAYSI
jgi:hypothetical protein